jgi:transaldolase
MEVPLTSLNQLRQLHKSGQSFWFDSLSRDMIVNGELHRLVLEDGLRGITSNPTIFHQAVSSSDLYDDTILQGVRSDKTSEEIFDDIAREDIQATCDVLRHVYDMSDRADGFVSLEENPHIASDTQASVQEGYRLSALIDRPNLLIKIPATPEGILASENLLKDGVNVNITLMFSLVHYDAVANAYITALEERLRLGRPLDTVASVASMFVSRIDTKVDEWIDQMINEESNLSIRECLRALRGKTAIANGRMCYQRYKSHFHSERFRKLAAVGARPQRILTASTSTKDPAYPDTYYVNALIGPETVVTMAPASVPAFRDHGKVERTIEQDLDKAQDTFRKAKQLGINMDQAMRELQTEGVEKFIASFDALINAIEEKRQKFLQAI